MKDWRQTGRKLLNGQGRLLVIGLAALLMVGLGSHWVNASSGATFAFTSPLPAGTPHPGHPGDDDRDLLKNIIDLDQLTANVLGISVEELQTARKNGTRLDELIQSLGLDEATVHQALKTAVATAVQQAVANGQISQEQANMVLTPPADPGQHGHGPDHGAGHPPQTPDGTITPPSEGGTIPPASGTPAATTTPGAATANPTDNAAPTHTTKHGSHDNHAATAQTNSSQNTTSTSTNTAGNSAQNNNNNSHQPQDNAHRPQRPGR